MRKLSLSMKCPDCGLPMRKSRSRHFCGDPNRPVKGEHGRDPSVEIRKIIRDYGCIFACSD